MSAPNLPPGCASALTSGVNCKRMDLLGSPIFTLTSDLNSVSIAGTAYTVPQEFGCDDVDLVNQSLSTLVIQTESDYRRAFSLSMSASLSSVDYSASVDSSFAYHGELLKKSDSTYTLNTCKKTLYEIRRNQIHLDSTFKAALDALSSSTTQDDFAQFFDQYGTHYLEKGYFGGFYSMETSILDTLVQSSSTTDITASLSAGFSAVVSSGKLDVKTAYSSSTFLSNHTSQTTVRFDWIGGSSNNDTQKFLDSITTSPVLLIDLNDTDTAPTLQPISKLVDQSKKATIENAISVYLNLGSLGISPPIDATWSDGNAVTIQAKSNGFALASRLYGANGDRGSVRIVTGPSGEPEFGQSNTAGAATCMQYYLDDDHHIDGASICVPVRSGDSYRAEFGAGSGSPKGTSAFAPFEPALGAWTDLQLDPASGHVVGPFKTDGFVLVSQQSSGDGNRGDLWVLSHTAGSHSGVPLAILSVHDNDGTDEHIFAQAACVPLPAGDMLKIDPFPSSGQPSFDAYVILLEDARFKFGPREMRQAGSLHTSGTPGFLFGCLRETANGNRATAKVYLGAAASSSSPGVPYACASMHYYQADDRWITSASLMMPVADNVDYKIVVDKTSGNPTDTWYWIPLLPA